MYGAEGRDVLRRIYCVSKMRLAAELLKRVSPVSLRCTAKEKGEAAYVNFSAASADAPSAPDGKG